MKLNVAVNFESFSFASTHRMIVTGHKSYVKAAER